MVEAGMEEAIQKRKWYDASVSGPLSHDELEELHIRVTGGVE